MIWPEFLKLLRAADRSYPARSGLVAVRVGGVFDAASVPAGLAGPVIEQLQDRAGPIGPILSDALTEAVVFLLPPCSAENRKWPTAEGVRVLARDEVLLCPLPGFSVGGLAWLVPPGRLSAGDPAVLEPILAAALGEDRTQARS
ncbi:hypothetical protein BIV57_10765 [Mangrovactinospora gilvigrisea]|uniref:Uncharacterized protein n=1 Tax=Mangrovactinospora gilvigrisea TaxID=1428644 RepID=A0A1J7CCP0_9ACTN|nr:hypothetical protein BIV57_10765 [Mangrovactinospora gilvigrisea]